MKWAFKQTAAQRTRFLKRACSGVHVEWQRVQFPLVPALPKTLHGLQGITADPGLIAHCRVPNVCAETKWLAYYVMLSRVRELGQFALPWITRTRNFGRWPAGDFAQGYG